MTTQQVYTLDPSAPGIMFVGSHHNEHSTSSMPQLAAYEPPNSLLSPSTSPGVPYDMSLQNVFVSENPNIHPDLSAPLPEVGMGGYMEEIGPQSEFPSTPSPANLSMDNHSHPSVMESAMAAAGLNQGVLDSVQERKPDAIFLQETGKSDESDAMSPTPPATWWNSNPSTRQLPQAPIALSHIHISPPWLQDSPTTYSACADTATSDSSTYQPFMLAATEHEFPPFSHHSPLGSDVPGVIGQHDLPCGTPLFSPQYFGTNSNTNNNINNNVISTGSLPCGGTYPIPDYAFSRGGNIASSYNSSLAIQNNNMLKMQANYEPIGHGYPTMSCFAPPYGTGFPAKFVPGVNPVPPSFFNSNNLPSARTRITTPISTHHNRMPVRSRPTNRPNCACPNCQAANKIAAAGMPMPKVRHNCHVPGCGKEYDRTSHLKAHLRWHNTSGPFVCNYNMCGKRFVQNDELERHQVLHSTEPVSEPVSAGDTLVVERSFVCSLPDCTRKFTRPDLLVKHQRIHRAAREGAQGKCESAMQKGKK